MLDPNKLSYTVDEAAKAVGVSKRTGREPQPFPPEWKLAYGLAEAANELGVSLRTLWRAINAGKLPVFSWCGRTLIRADVLREYIRLRDNPPPPEPKPEPPPLPRCGVYLLYDGGALSYIGRARNLRQRLSEHRSSGRKFDEARVIPCEPDVANWLEAELIRVLRPPANILRYARRAKAAERALEGLLA